MKKARLGPYGFIATFCSSLLLIFQNCGPANLSGSPNVPASHIDMSSTIGSKVDLASLLLSPKESASNVLFPAPEATNEYDYAIGSPILENLVLRNNSFTRIEWVHARTETIVAMGETFNQTQFSSDLLGDYYVFGYRSETPYLITRFKLIHKGPTNLGVNSANAVTLTQRSIDSDGTSESVLVTAEAPAVDLRTVQFTLKNDDTSILGKRAILVQKKLNETLDVEVILTDLTGQSLIRTINLTAKTTPGTPTTTLPTTTTTVPPPPTTTTVPPPPTTTTLPPTTTTTVPMFTNAIANGKSYRLTSTCETGTKVLAIKDANMYNEGQAIIETRNVSKNSQIFKAIYSPANNAYNLVATHSGRYLDIRQNLLTNGALIQQWAAHGGTNQLFAISMVGVGIFRMQALSSGRFIELNNGDTTDGNYFNQWDSKTGCTQQFRFEEVPNAPQPPLII